MTIEEYVIASLTGQLSVPVSGDVPSPKPASFVTVEKTGGGSSNTIQSATLAVQAWAESRDAAALLCAAVETAMDGIVAHPEISRCSLSSSYNFTDTSTKRYRYQALFDVVHYL